MVIKRHGGHSYDVQDAMGLRHDHVHVKHLRRDHTEPAPGVDRRPLTPYGDALGETSDRLAPAPDSFVILASKDENRDKWYLAHVLPDQEYPDECQIQYMNRGLRSRKAPVNTQVFRPAYVTTTAPFNEMYTYFPGRYLRTYEPYTRTVPAHMVLLTDVRLTADSKICMADIRRISDHEAIDWAFRPKRISPDVDLVLDEGLHVLQQFGDGFGWHVGEVEEVLPADDQDDVGYRVRYRDGEVGDLTEAEVRLAAREYLKSGYTDTEAATQPGRGNLHRTRLAQRMAARPVARGIAAMRANSRSRRNRRAQAAVVDAVPVRAPHGRRPVYRPRRLPRRSGLEARARRRAPDLAGRPLVSWGSRSRMPDRARRMPDRACSKGYNSRRESPQMQGRYAYLQQWEGPVARR